MLRSIDLSLSMLAVYALALRTSTGTIHDRFIRAAYQTLLQRDPDQQGLNYFRQGLENKQLSHLDIIHQIRQTAEYQAIRRRPSVAVIQRYYSQTEQLYEQLGYSQPGLSNEQRWVSAVYQTLLQREAEPAVYAEILKTLNQGKTRNEIFLSVLDSAEYHELTSYLPSEKLRRKLDQRFQHLTWLNLLMDTRKDIEAQIQILFRAVLERQATPQELKRYSIWWQRDTYTLAGIYEQLIRSSEFKRRHGIRIPPIDALHEARQILFQNRLPAGEIVVDLGGAAHNSPDGALLLMGYPHTPRQITIVDLPPAERIGGIAASENHMRVQTTDGILIEYRYGSMVELEPIADESVDLAVSGQTIEHISPEHAIILCQQVYRILKPGGYFCLDTPNARLTRLQSPDQFIHPEHQKEYYAHELRELLQQSGFEIVAEGGITPMPRSLALQSFDLDEMCEHIELCEKPEEGYLLYFQAQKPHA